MKGETVPSLPSSLHTLGDADAEQYIHNCLNDVTEPLINPGNNMLPGSLSQNNIDHGLYQNQYYIEHTPDDIDQLIDSSKKHKNCGMSPVRRMFCLLALFDGLLMFLMWIIYVQISGGKLFDKIKKEVEDFEFRKSFFDVAASSFIRSLFLLSVYGTCCKSSKWYAVAFSTAISTVYLLVKVFMTSFKIGQPMNYILIIFSFVICWCEVWHFDFQVIPREMNEDKIAASLANSARGSGSNVMPPDVLGIQRDHHSRGAKSSAFFTPYAGSIYRPRSPSEDSSDLSNLSFELDSAFEDDRQFIQIADDTVHLVFRMLYVSDGWTLERLEDNIAVRSRDFQGIGKVYKLEALFNIPREILDKLFWEDVDSQPSWNLSVKESQVVRKINNKTEILYTVSAEAGAGIIASRDFVSIRRRKRKDPLTLLCSRSIETELVPENKSIIRGTNGPGGWILREIPSEPNQTEFIWLLNTNLKGWLPQRLVDQSIVGVMMDTCKDICQHASNLGMT